MPGEYMIPLNLAGTEALTFAPLDKPGAGWARYWNPEIPERNLALVRIGLLRPAESGLDWKDLGTPLGIREVQFAVADGAMVARLVRELPFGRIIAAVNRPRHYSVIAAVVEPSMYVPLPAAGLWRNDLPVMESLDNPNLKLPIPPGRQRKPDAFYGKVADAFAWLAGNSASPAAELARENDVPVTTVHRWVKEARARGLLPPATGKGRRGSRGESPAATRDRD